MAVAATADVEEIIPERDGERGQGMVEYAFILVLIAMVVLVSLMVLGKQTANLYSNISSGLGT
jgi:pilus assembly protein Flp/PilA